MAETETTKRDGSRLRGVEIENAAWMGAFLEEGTYHYGVEGRWGMDGSGGPLQRVPHYRGPFVLLSFPSGRGSTLAEMADVAPRGRRACYESGDEILPAPRALPRVKSERCF